MCFTQDKLKKTFLQIGTVWKTETKRETERDRERQRKTEKDR